MTLVLTHEHWPHKPVLGAEIVELAKPVLNEQGVRILDATFGRGGHLRLLLENFGTNVEKVVALDQDPEAIQFGLREFEPLVKEGRLQLIHSSFAEFDAESTGPFDLILMDLGVSSPQLDTPERGFSFYHNGPLDMRMNTEAHLKASDIINEASERELIHIFKDYGEIRSPYRVVRAIVHDRKTQPFHETRQLASLIERVEGWRKKGFHPATQYFQALRIAVNSELEVLERGLKVLTQGLNAQGRIIIISFHSLEDRLVKHFFKSIFGFKAVNKKVITPSESEIKINSRSRSAKLRCYEKLDVT